MLELNGMRSLFVLTALSVFLSFSEARAEGIFIKSPSDGDALVQNTPQAVLVNVHIVSMTAGGTSKVSYMRGNASSGSYAVPFAKGATVVAVNTTAPTLPAGGPGMAYQLKAETFDDEGNSTGTDEINVEIVP